MVKFMMAGIIAFSMSSTEVNWKEITADFSHWSYHSQKEVKQLQETEHCFVWHQEGEAKYTIPQKKAKK